MSVWTDTVKNTFHTNRKKNSSYSFKQALKDAKKVYKQGTAKVSTAAKKVSKGAKKATRRVKRAVKGKRGKTARRR